MSSYNKTKLQVWIPNTLNEKFRELIARKYPKYEKGLLSYEVEMALRHWLSLHTRAQSQVLRNPPNPKPKVYLIFSSVKDWLLRNYYEELKSGQQIPLKHIREAIIAVRGADTRTVKKWLDTFHKMGLIKPVTSATWEIF